MTARSAADIGLEVFIMERQLVLQEEARFDRRRRRFLRATGAVMIAGVLASEMGLAAAGTGPIPAAQSAIEFLFSDEPPPPDEFEPVTAPTAAPVEAADHEAAAEAPATTGQSGHVVSTPGVASAVESPAIAAPRNSGTPDDGPGQAPEGDGTAPGNSPAHVDPSPPGQSTDNGNPNPNPPGMENKAERAP